MKKKVLFFGFLLFIGVYAFSIDFLVNHYDTVRITDNKLFYYGFLDDPDEEYDITWENINGIEYITFNYTGEFLDRHSRVMYNRSVTKGIKRYLILYGDQNDERVGHFLFLYGDNNELVFSKFSRGAADLFVREETLISAASELVEGNITYSARNLSYTGRLQPWAEGSMGSGIGEKILIELNPANPGSMNLDTIRRWRIYGIAFSNGFVDYNRPYLYQYNNRVKKIRVHFIDMDFFMDFDVLDTPQIQYFNFDRWGGSRPAKVQIEILEVYRGERWDDTCINGIFPFAGSR